MNTAPLLETLSWRSGISERNVFAAHANEGALARSLARRSIGTGMTTRFSTAIG
jgi:hypothetical protein